MTDSFTQSLLDELKQGYISALPGKVEEIEQYCLAMEKASAFADGYAALYRAVHSLKGSGGTYGYHVISSACHQMEDWLGTLEKADRLEPLQANVLLEYVDVLREIVENIQRSESNFINIERHLEALKKRVSNNKLHGLVVDRSRVNARIISETLGENNVQLALTDSSITALSRLMTEKFDFVVVASQEVGALTGSAMIAALKLSRGVSRNTKTILFTSNPNLQEPETLQPDVVIKKDAKLAHNFAQSMLLLGLSNAA